MLRKFLKGMTYYTAMALYAIIAELYFMVMILGWYQHFYELPLMAKMGYILAAFLAVPGAYGLSWGLKKVLGIK